MELRRGIQSGGDWGMNQRGDFQVKAARTPEEHLVLSDKSGTRSQLLASIARLPSNCSLRCKLLQVQVTKTWTSICLGLGY